MVLRAVKPVPTPKSMRPGASLLSVARPLAVTGAMRLEGTSTPVPRRMREVWTAATAMEANRSAHRSCVSTSHACEKPSASARCTTRHASTPEVTPMPKSMPGLLARPKRFGGRGRRGGREAEVAARTPRAIARATTSAATRPRRVRSAGTSPTESAKRVSPSKAVCGGESARAKPSMPSDGHLRRLRLAQPRVGGDHADRRVRRASRSGRARAVERSARAESKSRRPSGASRVPAISAPVSGSRTSPSAFTATMRPHDGVADMHARRADASAHGAARSRGACPRWRPSPRPRCPRRSGPAAAAAAAA